MKKIMIAGSLLFFVSLGPAMADNLIITASARQFPPPEICASCHKVSHIYEELADSGHKDLQCFDCHIPGKPQLEKYKTAETSFTHLGYQTNGKTWVETDGNNACLRCHADMAQNTEQSCWSCHMPGNGEKDKIVFVKDMQLGPVKGNIDRIKTLPHRSHTFKMH